MTIDEICRKYGITNYIINDDETIDVNGDVHLSFNDLTELPLTFNKVTGWFSCSNNKLTSLKGSPRWVGGCFYCDYNQLTDLVGSPKHVGKRFYCGNKQLNNPKGCPEKIGDKFYCSNSKLGYIFNEVDQHFLYTFNFYKIIKDDTVNLKRLKYVMDLYDKPIDLKRIEKYYRLV
jgi:hypothetical protein